MTNIACAHANVNNKYSAYKKGNYIIQWNVNDLF